MPMITNLEYNTLKRDAQILRVHEKIMRETLELIANSPKRSRLKGVASACLDFLNCTTPLRDLERIRKEVV